MTEEKERELCRFGLTPKTCTKMSALDNKCMAINDTCDLRRPEPVEELETSQAEPPEPEVPIMPLYGWVCPVCGAGLAPSTSVCPCRAPQYPQYTVTCKV